MLVLRISAVLMLFAGCGAVFAYEERAPSPGAWPTHIYRWRYNPQYAPSWLDATQAREKIQAAAAKWAACGLRMEYLGETDEPAGRLDGANVVGWNAKLAGSARAVTLGRADRVKKALLERDVVFNPQREDLRQSSRLLEKVMTHEFGHAIGLTHSSRCDDVMTLAADCPKMPLAQLPLELTPRDLDRCRALYDH